MTSTPTNEEQLMLQLINRARENPYQEMVALFNTGQNNIDGAVSYFNVNQSLALSQVQNVSAVAPVVWNTGLANSADNHSNLMIQYDQQAHFLPGEPGLIERFENGGFVFNGGGAAENIFAYSQDALHAHAGFYIDWGNGPGGIQDPAGHRDTILSASMTQVGLAMSPVPASNNVIGPYAVTQHFAYSGAYGAAIAGVAIDDQDNDSFYDIGEGLGGISITATGASGTFSTTTWGSGGYTLYVPAGSYTVTFSGNAIGADQSFNVNVGNSNVTVDAFAQSQGGTGSGGASSGDDFLSGTPGADFISLLAGNDRYFAGGGNDTVNGDADNDRLFGDGGSDTLNGNSGSDKLFGGAQGDLLNGGSENDTVTGNDGNDTLNGDGGDDKAYGGNGNDQINGGANNDALFGDAGEDTIDGGGGNDRMFGGPDNDTIIGTVGNDTLGGGTGNDSLQGGTGNNKFYGDLGDDTLNGGSGDNVLTAGGGNDLLTSGSGVDRLNGQDGNDTLNSGGGNDQLNGGADNDVMSAGANNDRLIGGSGADNLDGGSGQDTLFGGTENDTMQGGTGDDRLDGGSGSDSYTGGAGADTFILGHNQASSNGDVDTITDLDFLEDELIIRSFGGNAQVTVNDSFELYSLTGAGLNVYEIAQGTRLDFTESGTTHSAILEGIFDPFGAIG